MAEDLEITDSEFKHRSGLIVMSPDYLKIIRKGKMTSNLCFKHILIQRLIYKDVPRYINIFDPNLQGFELEFDYPGIANLFEYKIKSKQHNHIINKRSIEYEVTIINNVDVKKEFVKNRIHGMTTGGEMKTWIKETYFTDLYEQSYMIELFSHVNYVTIQDEVPILTLYEHINCRSNPNYCNSKCNQPIKIPKSLNIFINLKAANDHKSKNELELYNIKEKWGANWMPKWLMKLLSDLFYQGKSSVGVFRINGLVTLQVKYYKLMLEYDDFFIRENIHRKAGIFKYFLKHIKGSLMTKKNTKDLDIICEKIKKDKAGFFHTKNNKNKLINIFLSLPRNHLSLLQHILVILHEFTQSQVTNYNVLAVSKTIAPSIFILLKQSNLEVVHSILECLILSIDDLIKPDEKIRILENFKNFYINIDLALEENENMNQDHGQENENMNQDHVQEIENMNEDHVQENENMNQNHGQENENMNQNHGQEVVPDSVLLVSESDYNTCDSCTISQSDFEQVLIATQVIRASHLSNFSQYRIMKSNYLINPNSLSFVLTNQPKSSIHFIVKYHLIRLVRID